MKKFLVAMLLMVVGLAVIDATSPKVERAGGTRNYINPGHGADKV